MRTLDAHHRAARAGATLLVLLALHAVPAAAQSSRDWGVCFTSGVLSCTDLFLTTTPQLVGTTRTGTLVHLLVRHHAGGDIVSALQDVSFLFGDVAGDGADSPTLTPAPLGGAPAAPSADGWGADARTVAGSTDPLDAMLSLHDLAVPFALAPAVTPTQWIGGCNGAVDDGYHRSPLQTCGAGAYAFDFVTAAQFDADQVATLALDVYGAAQTPAGGVGSLPSLDAPTVAWCSGPAAGGTGVGFDGVDPVDATPCVVGAAATVAMEPPTLVLLGAGLLLLALRRRRRALTGPVRDLPVRRRTARVASDRGAFRHALGALALLLVGATACSDREPLAPDTARTPSPALTALPSDVAAQLSAAVADAQSRVLPTLDVELQPATRAALDELRAALDAGAPERAGRAAASLRALVATHAPKRGDGGAAAADADAPDVASLDLLAQLVATSIGGPTTR